MRVDVLTLFPEFVAQVLGYGVTARAVERGLIEVHTHNPREYATDRHRSVDDRPFGGGPGMVMTVEPLRTCIRAVRKEIRAEARTVFLSPQGKPLDQDTVNTWARFPGLVLVAGRYEGVDERFIETEIDDECSIGDYVLSGGELAAMVIVDALARLLPGALGHADSAREDSFMEGLLDCPHYSRPASVDGLGVPQVLLSGDHEAIRRWRLKQSLGRTCVRRPELLARRRLDEVERALLDEYLNEQGIDAGSCSDVVDSVRGKTHG
ncbi:MAG: tRNA (guanosine(37)-N1)-methyltransferase TrmD [Pseudomonadota bacterium]|nr:tRNA (guanosine(37)-N1)-methyltransferase TrmD [Pseudomonadota bacterium]